MTQSKLIHFDWKEAHGIICIYDTSDSQRWPENMLGYLVPKYLITGVFDDGSVKISGVENLNYIKNEGIEESFSFDSFLDYVSLDDAVFFVNDWKNREGLTEKDAKSIVFKDLTEAEIKMSEKAKAYLLENDL